MQLKSFRVGPYRNAIDTTDIVVDADVTVLVGKNESGKTNLLHALHALNPANGKRGFPRLDYPRWLQKRHQRSGEYDDAKPIEVMFALEDADVAAVAQRFGEDVLRDGAFAAYRAYESAGFTWFVPRCDVQNAISNALAGLDVMSAPNLESLREQLTTQAGLRDDEGNPTPEAEAANSALERVQRRFGDHKTVAQAVGNLLLERMPTFFYFDDFAQLPGTTDIGPLVDAIQNDTAGQLDNEQRTALALLRMGYADQELVDENYDVRKAELQAVGAELTSDVLSYWRQNPHLRLTIDINPVPHTGPKGEQIIRRELKLDVMDDRHHFTNSLDARSSGFRWFVSFIAAFAEFETDTNVIVLLDEPALGLHARAQADFLRFIEQRLADRHQVLFTTHSPFMVDASHLERVRVVEDTGPETGTKVAAAGGASKDPDTLFPLQAALGYDIAQNLFVGPDNLVVEGLSDFTYLTVMSEHLDSLDRVSLDERWRVLPVGGAANIPTFVSLVGQALDVTVLADGGEASGQRLRGAVDSGLIAPTRMLTPEPSTDVKDADIEDLFSVGDYLMLYRGSFGSGPRATDLEGHDRVLNRIRRAAGEFNHNAPARYLLHNRQAILPKLTETTLTAFEDLFKRINATLS